MLTLHSSSIWHASGTTPGQARRHSSWWAPQRNQDCRAERRNRLSIASDICQMFDRHPPPNIAAMLRTCIDLPGSSIVDESVDARSGPCGGAVTNLPRPLTSFVGRDAELARLDKELVRARLVTLIGAGGCGKTRLALHVAAQVTAGYPDGVWWVELGPVSDAELVPTVVARA